MGYYATTSSINTLMIGTTFDSATTALCVKMITDAENEVNKYLSKRYDISVFLATTTAVPPLVTTLTETLTEGYMYKRMARGGKEGLAHAKSLIDPVLENLEMISTYKADLLDSDGDVIAEASTSAQLLSTTSDYSNTFNEDSELNWAVDQDKLDAIESERS